MLNARKSVQKYKLTLFDRYGPGAGVYVRAASWGFYVFGVSLVAGMLVVAQGGSGGLRGLVSIAAGGIVAGTLTTTIAVLLSNAAGGTYKHLMVNGASTPYQKQYSMQDAMVMQGRIAEAIASFEVIIAERPDETDAYVRVAELYARDGNPRRALELLRHVQAVPTIEPGQDIDVSYRIVDLYDGPLDDRGRAIVELRRLIDRHPDTRVAGHAREALAKLKAEHIKIE